MKTGKLLGIGLALLALILVTGCGGRQDASPKADGKTSKKSKEDHHEHGDGPHGGTVADWGGGTFHVEFCMDHAKKQATVYILDGNAKNPAPIKTDKLLLSIKNPSFQIDLKAMPQQGDPQGLASCFIGGHDNFATEQEFAGTISGEVDGKPYAGDFKEEPATKK